MHHSADLLESTNDATSKLEGAIGHLSRLIAEQDDDPEHIDPRELESLRDELSRVLIELDCLRMLGEEPTYHPKPSPDRSHEATVVDFIAARARLLAKRREEV